MKKTMIDGEFYVKLKDLRYAIRHLRRMIPANYRNFDEDHRALVHLAYGDITKALYRDELKEAHTPEEIRKVLEMPGSWQVVKIIGKRGFTIRQICPIVNVMSDVIIQQWENFTGGKAIKI